MNPRLAVELLVLLAVFVAVAAYTAKTVYRAIAQHRIDRALKEAEQEQLVIFDHKLEDVK